MMLSKYVLFNSDDCCKVLVYVLFTVFVVYSNDDVRLGLSW